MNQRKWGAILSYIYIILSNTISLVYTPYMLRMLGQSEYGLYGTATSFISYLSILSFGIGGSYIRFNARCRANNDVEGEKRFNGMYLTIFAILSLLVLICGLVFIVFAEQIVKGTFTLNEIHRLKILMLIMTLNMVVTFTFNVVMMALQAYERFVFIRSILIACSILTPVVNVIALSMGGKAIAICVITLVFSLASYMTFLIYAWSKIKLRFSFRGFDKQLMKEVFIFSGFLFLNSITDTITFSTDGIILGAVEGTVAVAVYTIGANFKNYFLGFSTAISSVFAPQVNQIVAQGRSDDELNEIFIRIGRVQFYVVSFIMIGYISIGHDFVRVWAGEDYSEAYWMGLMLMAAVFVPAFQNVGIEIQKAKNMHKARSIVYFLIALVNVGMTIPFSIWWGGKGAALATMICMFAGTVIFMNIYYWKRVGLDIPKFWKSIGSILPGYIIPVAIGLGMNYYFEMNNYWLLLLGACVVTVVFCISTWFISMNDYEKDLFKKPVVKVIGRLKRK